MEAEIEAIHARLGELDEQLKKATGDEQTHVQDARDKLVERLQEIGDQLPPGGGDLEPCPDNVVDMNGSSVTRDGRRNILVTPRVHEMLDEATEAFAESNYPPKLFQRARKLVRLETDALTGEEAFVELGVSMFTTEISRMMNFCERRVGEEGRPKLVPAFPHKLVVNALMESPPRSAPAVKRVAHAPFMRAGNGYVVTQKGYHSDERIYLAEDYTNKLHVPDKPTNVDVRAARDLIYDDLLGDYRFAHRSDKAHAMAALLEPLVGEIVAGPNPLHLFEATIQGSGKTHLGDIVSVIAQGRPNNWITLSKNKEEQEKTLGAKLLQLPPFIGIDNLKGPLDLPLLDAALTGSVEVRILGRSEMSPVLDTRGMMWVLTANQAKVSDDALRRMVRSRLEPEEGAENLDERTFRHPDLIAWAKQHRAELLTALLVLARNWFVKTQGGFKYSGRKFPSFKEWSEVIGGILEAAGIEGFLDDKEIRRELMPDDTAEWHELVDAWRVKFGHRKVTARELLDELVAPVETRTPKDAPSYTVTPASVTYLTYSLGEAKVSSRAKTLGNLLRARRKVNFHGWKIVGARDTSTNATEYRLEEVDPRPCPAEPASPTSNEAGDFST